MRKFVLIAVGLLPIASLATDHVVRQSAKAFSVTSLRARVGDTIEFRNEDPFVHNIFSLSDAQSFDLGTFAKGQTRSVKLESAGRLEIECAVHPEMKLTVEVGK